jgi:hypothetical protein
MICCIILDLIKSSKKRRRIYRWFFMYTRGAVDDQRRWAIKPPSFLVLVEKTRKAEP